MDTRIYVMTHKEFTPPKQKIYLPLQVGHAGKKDLGYLADDTGDHISDKNANYCELTGLYWMWKNVSCEIAGLCHYRRYFVRPEGELGHFLTQTEIEETLREYDIILPNSSTTREGTVFHHYEVTHEIQDLLVCGDVVHELYPEYESAFVWSLSGNFMSLGNMIITRKEILDEYCNFLFRILFEVERRIDLTGRDAYQTRVFGFLSERLLRTWVLNQPYRVREEQVVNVELDG